MAYERSEVGRATARGWELALKIEHKVQEIITQQEIDGVQFDIDKAWEYRDHLEYVCSVLYDRVRPLLSMEVVRPGKTISKPYKANGEFNARVHKYLPSVVLDCVWGPFSPVGFQEPDLGKRNKLIAQLSKLGWRPTEWTDKGNPKLTEESMYSLQGNAGKLIARWYILKHRKSQIEGWIKRLRPDGRLTAGANPCGTNTGRMTHKTVVNVPKASRKVIFGKQMRSLFIAKEGYVLVGHDASGLELRILAHYMNDKDYIDLILNGDIHSFNQKMAGLPTRDMAKTFIYGLVYGAQDAKIGQIIDGTRSDGKRLRATFYKNIPAIKKLMEKVDKASNRGYLISIDGRKVYIRSKHSALNTLIQSAGSIAMKLSLVYLNKWVKKEKLDVKFVINMHDEIQAEVHPKDVERYKELAEKSVVKAGEYLKIRCPLDAEAKVGQNWSQTH